MCSRQPGQYCSSQDFEDTLSFIVFISSKLYGMESSDTKTPSREMLFDRYIGAVRRLSLSIVFLPPPHYFLVRTAAKPSLNRHNYQSLLLHRSHKIATLAGDFHQRRETSMTLSPIAELNICLVTAYCSATKRETYNHFHQRVLLNQFKGKFIGRRWQLDLGVYLRLFSSSGCSLHLTLSSASLSLTPVH